MISHWDDREWSRRDRGHIGGEWQSLTGSDSVTVGAKRMRIDPGKWSTPAHVEAVAEEIFFVLSGSGVSWQDGHCYPVREGDALVHLAQEAAHTLRAGDDGLEVIAFGHRAYGGATFLPRAGVSWLGPTWARTGAEDEHPWTLEAAAGAPEVGELEPRPSSIVNLDELEPTCEPRKTVGDSWRDLGTSAGSERTGLNHSVGIPRRRGRGAPLPAWLHGAGNAPGAARLRPLPAGGNAHLAQLPQRRASADLPRLRHARAERDRLLPEVGEGQLQRCRRDRAARTARLLGWRGLTTVKESGG